MSQQKNWLEAKKCSVTSVTPQVPLHRTLPHPHSSPVLAAAQFEACAQACHYVAAADEHSIQVCCRLAREQFILEMSKKKKKKR